MKRAGFTLIEILVGFAILVVFFVGVFTIVSKFSKAGTVGQWRSVANAQIRKSQVRIRQNIEGASYPMLITPQSNAQAVIPDHYVIINPEGSGAADDNSTEVVRVFGPGEETLEPGNSDDVILQLIRSKPGREGLGNSGVLVDKPVEATQVKLVLRDHREIYGGKYKWCRNLYLLENFKSLAPAGFDAASPFDFAGGKSSQIRLANNVNEVRIAVPTDSLPGGTSSPDPALIEIQIRCVEPSEGKSEVISRIRAFPNAGVELR